MRYSKILLVIALSFVMIFGGMIGSFAEEQTLMPPPLPSIYTLTLIETPDEGGNIYVNPDHSHMLPDFNYWKNAEVKVTVTVANGYRLKEVKVNGTVVIGVWDHGCYKIPNVIMNENKTIEAVFVKLYKLDTGTMPTLIDDSVGAGWYAAGDTIDLSAKTHPLYGFLNWKLANSEDIISITNDFTFTMPANDVKVVAHYLEVVKVNLLTNPSDKGLVEFSGLEYIGEPFTIHAKNVDGQAYKFAFWAWDNECLQYQGPEEGTLPEYFEPYPDMSITTNPDPSFIYSCDTPEVAMAIMGRPQPIPTPPEVTLTAYYYPVYAVTTTHIDTASVALATPVIQWFFNGQNYTTAPLSPLPTGFDPPAIPVNDDGIIDEADVSVQYIYQKTVPPTTVTNTVTNTVYETVFVPVPATTAAPTTEAITEEVIPLGAFTIMDFDEIYADEEPVVIVEPPIQVVVEEEETPLADALPQTGQLPVELFYGIGGLVSTLGIYIRRKR